MYELITIIRKRPDVSTEEFRAFMENEYGTIYASMPQTRSYTQYYLQDLTFNDVDSAIDAIVHIAFDSKEEMSVALSTTAYREAAERRKAFMREGPGGIHPTRIEKTVKLV